MSNEDFTHFLDTSDEWIVSNTGIRYRYVAREDQAASDLGLEAARMSLEKSGLAPEQLDLILVATATPDYRGFPSTASIIQGRLGASRAGAFDLAAACTGFVYGLETARSFIQGGSARHVLVVGTEVFSRILDYTDRTTCVLFGDGAGSVVVSAADGDGPDANRASEARRSRTDRRGILDSILGSDGAKAGVLTVPGGSRTNGSAGNNRGPWYLTMEGRPVYNFAVRVISEVVNSLLHRNGLSLDDLACIVPHQANIRILQAAAKRLKVSTDRFYTNIRDVANTSAASIPLALSGMLEEGRLEQGDLIITVGFGGGLTYGANLIRW